MLLVKPLFIAAIAVSAFIQDKASQPVTLPELPAPQITPVVKSVMPAPQAPSVTAERIAVAIYQNTVYLKVGDMNMVVPMVGTSGCFTPKELLKGDDPRLHFVTEIVPPPPPPAPA